MSLISQLEYLSSGPNDHANQQGRLAAMKIMPHLCPVWLSNLFASDFILWGYADYD
jgi:hypothetical protein